MHKKFRENFADSHRMVVTFLASSPWLTLAQAAEYAGVSKRIMRRWLKAPIAGEARGVCGSGANMMIKKDFLDDRFPKRK